MLLVCVAALALAVGTAGAAYVWTFVPIQAQPAQGFEDGGFGRGAGAGLVGVFDAQDEAAPVVAGEGVVEEGHVGGADMGIARWGWGRLLCGRSLGPWVVGEGAFYGFDWIGVVCGISPPTEEAVGTASSTPPQGGSDRRKGPRTGD